MAPTFVHIHPAFHSQKAQQADNPPRGVWQEPGTSEFQNNSLSEKSNLIRLQLRSKHHSWHCIFLLFLVAAVREAKGL